MSVSSWAELEIMRDADAGIDEMWVAVDVAATAEIAERRAGREYDPPGCMVPVATGRVWMRSRPIDWDDPDDAAWADDYGQSEIVEDCDAGAEGAREWWCVTAVDPSEVEMVRGEIAEGGHRG